MSKTDLLMFLHASACPVVQVDTWGSFSSSPFLPTQQQYPPPLQSLLKSSFLSAICPHPGTISPRKFTYLLTALRPLLWPLQSLCRRDYVGLLRQ